MALKLAADLLGQWLPAALVDHVILPFCDLDTVLAAFTEDDVEYARWLLKKGANPNYQQQAAGRMAVCRGLIGVAQLLITDPIFHFRGEKMYMHDLAVSYGQLPMLQWLVETFGYVWGVMSMSGIRSAIADGHRETVRYLIEHASCSEMIETINTWLWVWIDNIDDLKFVASFPGVNLAANDNQCFNEAAYKGKIETMAYLASEGVLDSPNTHLGWLYATMSGCMPSLQFLAQHDRGNGAAIAEALEYAVEREKTEVVAFLRTLL